jgi:hypothetical protein
MKSRKHGGENMIRKVYWGVLASLSLALAFGTGCSSNTASAPPTQVITVNAMSPFAQSATVNNPDVPPVAYASPFNVLVTTVTPPSTTPTPVGAGVVVTFSAPAAGAGGTFGSVGGSGTASATTNASGVATSPIFYANGNVGTYNVIAASPSTESTTTFYLSNTLTPAPAGTTVAGGSPQSTTAGTQFATALSVTVLDSTGAAVSGIPVTFKAPPFTVSAAGVPSVSSGTFADTASNSTTATTNSSGVATAAAFTANALADALPTSPYNVTAETPDGASAATFILSNTTMPVGPLVVGVNTTPQSATVSTDFSVPLSVTVLDVNLNPVTNAVVTFTAPSFTFVTPPTTPPTPTASSGDFYDSVTTDYDLLSVTAWTDVNGVATAPPFQANALAGGPYNVTATVVVGGGNPANPPLTTNFALTNNP